MNIKGDISSKTIYEEAFSCRNCLTFLEVKSKYLSLPCELYTSILQKNLIPSPIFHELLKYQSQYHHRVYLLQNFVIPVFIRQEKTNWCFDEHPYTSLSRLRIWHANVRSVSTSFQHNRQNLALEISHDLLHPFGTLFSLASIKKYHFIPV